MSEAEDNRRLEEMARSLSRKLPFVAPECIEEKIWTYLRSAYQLGRAAPSTERHGEGDR